ncbi:MAG: FISUMP domain-containing protein [Bacteroidota bacterium]
MALYLFTACNEAKIPVVTTNAVTEISPVTALSGGVITDDGGGKILEKGVCWDTIGRPKIGSNMTIDTTESLSFTSQITGLSPKTKYYVKAYATSIAGTGYGNMETFTTTGEQPSIALPEASDILTSSATLNGTVNPNLLSTSVSFEYGTTTSYGSIITTSQSPVSGDSETSVSAQLTGLNPGTTYHFRIKAENSLGTIYSSDVTFTTSGQVPSVENDDVTNLKIGTVTLNGYINPNHLSTTVFFEWGTSTAYGSNTGAAQGTLTGSTSLVVNADLSGLTPGTIYHYRICATNELGTSYSGDQTLKTYVVADADNNYYYSVTIGTQTWMQENLKTTHLRDGSVISQVTDNTAWKNLNSSGYCWYSNEETRYKALYGALYNWFAVSSGKLCPAGWHVPTNSEWITLTNYLGGEITAGSKLKESGSTHWGDLNTGTDETGFTALPGGSRGDDGAFANSGVSGHFWSSSPVLPTTSYSAVLYNSSTSLTRVSNPNVNGFSVRCVKD